MSDLPSPAYRSSATALWEQLISPGSAAEQAFINQLSYAYRQVTGKKAGKPQQRAWTNSLTQLTRDLIDADLGRIEVIVEYPMPHKKNSQADVILAGVGHDGQDAFTVIELKQWSKVELYERDMNLVVVEGSLHGTDPHPVRQLKGYCDQIIDYCSSVHGQPESVHGVVYLHNADRDKVRDLFDRAVEDRVLLFTKTDRASFLSYLQARYTDMSGAQAADRLLKGEEIPSKPLLKRASAILSGRDHFNLLDEQQLAFQMVLHEVDRARRAQNKRVIIIAGGPGTGKTAIALQLLAYFAGNGFTANFAAGSKSFIETIRRALGGGASGHRHLIKYFNEFANAENLLEVIIADEAHRTRAESWSLYNKDWRSDRPQIESLIRAARVPVFLLDVNQIVRPDEVGTVEEIKAQAQQLNVKYKEIRLDGQWRCGGSAAYDRWVHRFLGLGEEDCAWDGDAAPELWPGDETFELKLTSSPGEMEAMLREKLQDGCSARIAAGFCWPWSRPNKDGTLVADVRIGNWERPWNARSKSKVGDAPPSDLWASMDGGFDQIGCIYTAQGLEYDWAGVIIGPDLVARGGHLITVREGNRDPDLSEKSADDARFDRLVRNAYKVLLTRGLHGVVVYACDPETQQFLAGLIDQ